MYVCKCMFSSFLYCAPTSWPRAHHIVDVLLLAVWGCEQESFKFATEQCCWMAQFQLCQWLLPHTRRRHRKCSSPSFSVGLRTAKPWVNAQSADQAERDLRLASTGRQCTSVRGWLLLYEPADKVCTRSWQWLEASSILLPQGYHMAAWFCVKYDSCCRIDISLQCCHW